MIADFRVSYAQNREDIILSGFFPDEKDGFYVDVGANDPIVDSVTKYFYGIGWRGLNIEPLKQHYQALKKDRPRDINSNVGVGDKTGELVLREYTNGTGLSTFAQGMKDSYKDGQNQNAVEYIDHTVKIQPIHTIFEEQKITKISFMKVDVEGFEYEVLVGNDWKKFRPEVICIEANHIEKDWHKILKDNGYTCSFFDGLNEYYTDNNTDRAAKFSYVDTMLLRNSVLSYEAYHELLRYEETVSWLNADKKTVEAQGIEYAAQVDKLAAELKATQLQVNNLQSLLNDVTPLRRHIVKHVKHRLATTDAKITNRLTKDQSYVPYATPADSTMMSSQEMLTVAKLYDQKNAAEFRSAQKQSKLLPIYEKSKGLARRQARRVINKMFRG